MQKIISRLQFITYQEIEKPSSQQALEYCAGGGDWIQLGIKNKPEDYILSQARKCNSICQHYGATFIINDNPHLAIEVDADGVHLSKNHINVAEARNIIGSQKIIGATANTFEDIVHLAEQGADYLFLGTYGHTGTSRDINPELNLNDYTEILKCCDTNNIDIPIIAIGAITMEDFAELFETGIHGVAISSYLANQDNIGESTLNTLTEIGKAHSFSFIKR
ncbi:thiamine phosphate synthase [Saccharicrinis sp. 156]|uniref:thiamine phosphate synthase n=1 Tax=Saccharicrinis sp. 156 TaxID=3417574 RepID=UPI003D337DFD